MSDNELLLAFVFFCVAAAGFWMFVLGRQGLKETRKRAGLKR